MGVQAMVPARPEESLVQDVWPVGASQYNNACGGLETVHLHQQLIERVLPLIIPTSKAASPSSPPNSINLICRPSMQKLSSLLGSRVWRLLFNTS